MGCGWNSSLFTGIPKPFHHPMSAVAESGSYKNRFYLRPRVTQPTSSMRSGRRVWYLKKKNGSVSLSLVNQYFSPHLSLPGPNWTAVNCPICCQDQPHGLQRILAKEGLLQGWGWVGRWRLKFRHPMGPGAASDCCASWLHFESKAFTTPILPVSPNTLKAQVLFEVDLVLFTLAAQRC